MLKLLKIFFYKFQDKIIDFFLFSIFELQNFYENCFFQRKLILLKIKIKNAALQNN